MPGASHDPQLDALHAGASLPGKVLDLIALSADARLLATLRQASGAEYAFWPAQSADSAVELLLRGRCGLLIVDLDLLRGDPAPLFERLQAQFPELVLMAAGPRERESAVSALVAAGLIYRFLHKPVSAERAGLFIAAGARRYYGLHDLEPTGMTTVRMLAIRARAHRKRALLATATALFAATALVAWEWRSRAPQPPPSAPLVDAANEQEQIARELGRAHIAMATGRLAEPAGDNALGYFRAVLALQPDHAEARAGVERVLGALEAQLLDALNQRNAPAGAAAFNALRSAQPEHPRLAELQAQLIALSRSVAAPRPARIIESPSPLAESSAIQDAQTPSLEELAAADEPPIDDDAVDETTWDAALADDMPDAAETVNEPDPAQLQRIAQLRERGDLYLPAAENAYDMLIALRERYGEDDALRTEQQRLAFALIERARTQMQSERLEIAEAALERAESLAPGMSIIRSLQQQLAAAKRRREFETHVVPAASLKRVREAAPIYPREARRAGLEGWVDIEFTIAPDGSTRDFVVRDGERRDVFEKAAIDTVRRWRFEPVLRDGKPAPQRAELRVRFVMQ
ncbi:MAG: energy transducer TonB [Steroidobacteraceae bacterium]|jgi:TonB family protein|nr:energy transducer TonB [Steroidobacteraceae bacterium]